MEAFSKRLKQLRLESGKKQEEISADLNLSRGIISAYEHGREPSFDTLIMFAHYFHVTTDYLLGLSNDCATADDDLSTAIEQAARLAVTYGAPAITSSQLISVAHALAVALALEGSEGGSVEACRVASEFLEALNDLLAALASQSTARVLDATNQMLTVVTSVNQVLSSFIAAQMPAVV